MRNVNQVKRATRQKQDMPLDADRNATRWKQDVPLDGDRSATRWKQMDVV